MTFSHWSEEHFDWKRIAASIRTLLGDTYLFELYNSPDYYNNTEINTIYVITLLRSFLKGYVTKRFLG